MFDMVGFVVVISVLVLAAQWITLRIDDKRYERDAEELRRRYGSADKWTPRQ